MYKSVFRRVLLGLTVLAFLSCDKDFNEIGSGIVGDDHFDLLTKFDVPVVANTVATGPVESRNLLVNPLGVYKNAVFGTTIASFATQLELEDTAPDLDPALNPQITSVELTVPYFSRFIETDVNGARVYELDSVFGNGKFDLKVYRSGYYMRDISYESNDPQAQLFYTDEGPVFNSLKVGEPLNNIEGVPTQNTAFFFSKTGYDVIDIDEDGEETTTKFPPGMRLTLDNDVFQSAIIEAPSAMLANNNVFKNYFRGLYFKAGEISGDPTGTLSMLNFKEGKITIKYEEDKEVCTTVGGVLNCQTIRAPKTIVLNLAGNTASLLENSPGGDYADGLAQTAGSNSRLWLKGGEGSVATIDLFGTEDLDANGVSDELDQIREEDWMINEANLIFYIDQDKMAGLPEPTRLYLYDVTNKRIIVDYNLDGTTSSNPKFKKSTYGGLIQRLPKQPGEEDGRGIRYKIRLTNYINSLIKNDDSTNVRLGLAITESIDVFSMVKLKNANPGLKDVIPTAHVMSPLGTVIYGSTGDVPADKKLRLEIYYTKPE